MWIEKHSKSKPRRSSSRSVQFCRPAEVSVHHNIIVSKRRSIVHWVFLKHKPRVNSTKKQRKDAKTDFVIHTHGHFIDEMLSSYLSRSVGVTLHNRDRAVDGVMVLGNGHSNPNSNSGRGCLQFTQHLQKASIQLFSLQLNRGTFGLFNLGTATSLGEEKPVKHR